MLSGRVTKVRDTPLSLRPSQRRGPDSLSSWWHGENELGLSLTLVFLVFL